MRVLITGGAGYLGSVMCEVFLEDGFDVTVLDNFMWRQNSLAHLCHHPHFHLFRGDARDDRDLKRAGIGSCDTFIPLAALVGAPLCANDATAALTTNVEAIALATSLLSKDQMILIPISNSGYGVGEPGKMCTEESPLKPISIYGETKVKAEKIVMERGNAVSFRLATLFGMSPRMRLDLLVNDFVYRAVNDRAVVLFEADFKRNYIHVRDAVSAFAKALFNWLQFRDNIYNVGLSSANLSKRELCAKIKEHIPSFVALEAPIGEDPDKRDYIVSNAKIEARGWRPRYSLDDGIVELAKGYQMIRNTVHGNV